MRETYPQEAGAFLRAMDSGLMTVDTCGRCRFPGVRNPSRSGYGLFYGTGEVWLWREWLTQAAAAAELVLDYQMAQSDIAIELDGKDDVCAFGPDNSPLVIAEAKEEAGGFNGLRGLVEAVTACANRHETVASLVAPTDHEKKYVRLLLKQPPWFWAVAPGARWAFKVTYEDGAATLEQVDRLLIA